MYKKIRFKNIHVLRSILILLLCFVLIIYLWYTSAINIKDYAVTSINLRSSHYDQNLTLSYKEFFTCNFDEMQPILNALQKQTFHRKIPWNKILSTGVKANSVSLEGIQFLNIDISFYNESKDSHIITIEISSRGEMSIDGDPISTSRFGCEQNKLLLEELDIQ